MIHCFIMLSGNSSALPAADVNNICRRDIIYILRRYITYTGYTLAIQIESKRRVYIK